MSGPMQWTPNGLVPAMTSSSLGTIGAKAEFVDIEDDDPEEGAVVRTATVKPRSKQTPAVTYKINVVSLAKKRLREIESDLKRLRRLEKERDELKRLIDAAKNQPRAIVREIKRSAG